MTSPYLRRPLRPLAEVEGQRLTTAVRLREFCAMQSIRCPASKTHRRCTHSVCIQHGCQYEPADPEGRGDGMSINFEKVPRDR